MRSVIFGLHGSLTKPTHYFLLTLLSSIVLFAGLPSGLQAEEASAVEKQRYRTSVYDAWNFHSDTTNPIGHLTSLKIGSTLASNVIEVVDPEKPFLEGIHNTANPKPVGIISAIRWDGGVADPITFTCQVTAENYLILARLIYQRDIDTTVEFTFTIYDHKDQPTYYKAFHSGEQILKGIIEKTGGELEFEIDNEPSWEVPSPRNYELYLSVMPKEGQEQQLQVNGENKPWGGSPAPQAGGGLYALYQGSPIESDSTTPTVETGTLFTSAYPESATTTHTLTLDNFAAERTVSISISDYGNVPDGVEYLTEVDNRSIFADDYRRAGKSDFTVSPTTLTIPEGTYGAPGQATFDVSFKPGGKGLRQAIVTVEQDGESEVSFLVQGGTASPIQLRGGYGYYVIGDRDNTPEETDSTDFLTRKINDDPATHTFALYNSEMRDITVLTELRDATTGFSLSEQSVVVPAATDDGAGRATFDVTFDPATTGAHDTFVDLSYDGERQLSFKVSGEGENGGGGAVSPLGLALLGLILVGLGYRRSRLVK